MALKGTQLILIISFFISSLFAVTIAQSSSSCTSALLSLSPCLNFISRNETTPSSSCCSQLSTVVKSEPQCLCSVLNGDAASGLGISLNKTQALALPAACKVQTPPVSQCNTASSPPSTPASTPATPSGSKNVPSVDTGSANGSAAGISLTFVLSLIFQPQPSLHSSLLLYPPMALKGSQSILVIFFFMSSLFAVTTAQSSSSCQSALLSLSPCLNFITGKDTTPSSSCCTQLGSVVKSEPQCLCLLLNGDAASGLGISINKTQALELPTVCKVQTPSVSQCNTWNELDAGGGSKNVPSVDTGSANGSAAEVSITLVISLMFMVVFSSASAITV
ncbi:hypothetical protein IEQ34_007073 [Dendrobium chrysotoxum]|uniref:Bifunctional inhibitor/plant lipid transfer protein/seed storage helical domain-containing protein n=1 Tax=Dendrobium chrysotoxum TaxID=161865 RepID=A0AAV7H7B0_DENCH|nr:hypothetical protein IEQ34_007073 [Dendrobium chrysotoxum]